MDFHESLQRIRETIRLHGDKLINEEMTKQALILPMIEALGYDTRNPSEVMAEYLVRLPSGANGRADYVVMQNERPAIVIECKAANIVVDEGVTDQMREYAVALDATVGIATNGIGYSCFADVEKAGEMDLEPFCFINAGHMTSDDERALGLLAKTNIDLERIRTQARRHKVELEQQWRADEFVWAPSAQAELLRLAELKTNTEKESEIAQLVAKIGERMHIAVEMIALQGSSTSAEDGISTTGEELDAYYMVKGILHGVIDPDRVDFRDRQTYASVLIDNNNRRPICRFHFNGRQKFLGTFDQEKNETRHSIDGVNDIVQHANALRRTARQYV
ncbi:MAG: type I restriction enzyme HsdR N-terminal domain-containing protein [Chloroflexi bacterium]|nr:type I restriction enzyme HsdR N-terminal domain-containing protein [Chloroflexota bacterium]